MHAPSLENRHGRPQLDLIALQLFAGLALGAIYVLLAIGLSLIFGMLTVVNFAHGAFFMVGAYVGAVAADARRQFLDLPGRRAARGRRVRPRGRARR